MRNIEVVEAIARHWRAGLVVNGRGLIAGIAKIGLRRQFEQLCFGVSRDIERVDEFSEGALVNRSTAG